MVSKGSSPGSSPASWKALDSLLTEALSLPPQEQSAFISQVDDEAVRRHLKRLLAAAHSSPAWLRRGAAIGADMLTALTAADQQLGRRIGPFALCEEIGAGGMAQVYRARRVDGAYDQDVAVKIMWPGLIRPDLLARFERERQILARLDDPHIARLLDGGITEDGRPWLAMAFVDGLPIDQHCRDHALDLGVRLKLLRDVMGAVAAAHRRGIVHRDIKPSNVLVDSAGAVRLMDFGIAKLVDTPAEASTVTESRVLTPEYASPEQIEGGEITRTSDIYQLGLLMFELLTGRRPFLREDGSALKYQRAVVEQAPPLPSRTARRAGLVAEVDWRRCVGDLDAMVLKALEKQPADRYASVSDLARDLANYASGLPVTARSGSRLYRLRKFVSRNRIPVTAAAAFAALLTAYAFTVTVQNRQIALERDLARAESARSRELATFMQDLFANASPEVHQGEERSIRQMLDQGSRQLSARLDDQPSLKADMLKSLGRIYISLGEYTAAKDHLTRALALSEHTERSHSWQAQTRQALGVALRGSGDFDKALAEFEGALKLLKSESDADPLALASLYADLGVTFGELSDDDRSGEFHAQALTLRERHLPDTAVPLAISRADYGVVLHRQARREEAGELYRQAAAVLTAELGDRHPRTLTTLRNLAVLEIGLNNLPEAKRLLEDVLARELKIYDGDHPKMAWTRGYLGRVTRDLKQLPAAEHHWREAVRLLAATLPRDHLHTAGANLELAKVLLEAGQVDEACERMESTLNLRLQKRGEQSERTAQAQLHLGRCLSAQGHRARARELLAAAQPLLKAPEDLELLNGTLVELDQNASAAL